MMLDKTILVFVISLSPTYEHFIWPLHVCLIADMCNHTWYPECGYDRATKHTRLFLDMCDLLEYNCDKERNYIRTNYSDCFVTECAMDTCPPAPPCVRHKYHRTGKHIYEAPKIVFTTYTVTTTVPDLPSHMLKGKRRYTPRLWKWRSEKNESDRSSSPSCSSCVLHPAPKPQISRRKMSTPNDRSSLDAPPGFNYDNMRTTVTALIIKRETIIENGKRKVRIIKRVLKNVIDEDDFLQ